MRFVWFDASYRRLAMMPATFLMGWLDLLLPGPEQGGHGSLGLGEMPDSAFPNLRRG